MKNRFHSNKGSHAFYSGEFTRRYKNLFRPFSRALFRAGVTPNTVTFVSLILAAVTGILLAMDYLWTGFLFGLAMGFADTVDGQIAKESGSATKFGGLLDSTIDRYNEFFIFAGLAFRYYFHGRPLGIIGCALAFFGSIMTSYVRARAETEGFDCKVGRLQRPERLTIIGFGVLFRSVGIDVMVAFLAVATQFTALYRLLYVYRQSGKIE